ncbi:ATP-dependent DNA helicase Rep [subsurface metagenome]
MSSILAVTFTNKAAREMMGRIRSLDQKKKLKDLTVCTFHALGLKILVKFGNLLGFKGNLTIYDQTDKQSLIKELIHELNLVNLRIPGRYLHYFLPLKHHRNPGMKIYDSTVLFLTNTTRV